MVCRMEVKDGLCLTYIKDGVMYPVGISKEQDTILQNIIPSMLGKLYVYTDKPIGDVINYMEKTNEKTD